MSPEPADQRPSTTRMLLVPDPQSESPLFRCHLFIARPTLLTGHRCRVPYWTHTCSPTRSPGSAAAAALPITRSPWDKLNLSCIHNAAVGELMRGIRTQVNGLISGLPPREISAMSLGLAHSLSRYKLKFSPDKVDTMIVQAISLLDDLDKELNNYIMRCREWYGWHFPELGKTVTDNLAYCKCVQKLGDRTNTATTDLSDILPEEVENAVKVAAEISMGTEVSEEDIEHIIHLCDQVVQISEYRTQLYDYLKNRMMAIAPNLTVMVGELVGARLIAHAGKTFCGCWLTSSTH
ncbi:nucleolar protein 58-like [Rhincodon typus]|uniref:nucleolar protein 58-like n=1 Tax=Rhincodon typus TaxID=259920 RepID=UPI00202F3926|nr:nucleolar protein 58-like [Rhincodon typus]